MTYSITIPVANWAQGRAYIGRIEGAVLNAKALDAEDEGANIISSTQVSIFVSTPERLLAVTKQLFAEEYI